MKNSLSRLRERVGVRAQATKKSSKRFLSDSSQRLHLPRQPELAQGREAHALVQNLEAVALDLVEQGAVDACHHQARLLAAPVGGRQQLQRLLVERAGAVGLE